MKLLTGLFIILLLVTWLLSPACSGEPELPKYKVIHMPLGVKVDTLFQSNEIGQPMRIITQSAYEVKDSVVANDEFDILIFYQTEFRNYSNRDIKYKIYTYQLTPVSVDTICYEQKGCK